MCSQIEETYNAAYNLMDKRLGMTTTPNERILLLKHLLLLIEKNRVLNLTRIDTVESGLLLHIEDSLTGYKEFKEYCTESFCDMGTGGGYPGIPLAIMSERKGLLVDSVKKKATAIQEFIENLKLDKQIEAAGIRLEELATDKPEEYSFVTARALSSLPSILELAAPLLHMEGHLLAYKGVRDSEEEARADLVARIVGLEPVYIRETVIGEEGIPRTLYLYKKVNKAQVRLPRKNGLAQKKPLA